MSVLSDKEIADRSTPPTHLWMSQLELDYLLKHDPERISKINLLKHPFGGVNPALSTILDMGHAVELTPELLAMTGWKPMIEPFLPEQLTRSEAGDKIASAGLSSYGYDIRAAGEWKLFKGVPEGQAIDYKNVTDDQFETFTADKLVIPPHGFVLTRSVEYVRIPRDILALCIGKSTIARVGINCLCTPLEPEWEGHITLEFHNTTNQPNTIYANEGVLQLVFLKAAEQCAVSYADRKGKYMGQGAEIILPRV